MVISLRFLDITREVHSRMEGESTQTTAGTRDAFNQLFYWNNADLVAFNVYLESRLPLTAGRWVKLEIKPEMPGAGCMQPSRYVELSSFSCSRKE